MWRNIFEILRLVEVDQLSCNTTELKLVEH
jgi:hypothetical protein